MKEKKDKDIEVKLIFTEGWEERVTKALYNLYIKVESRKRENLELNLLQEGA